MSRNNDLDGYWALGKLYAHARSTKVREIRIDVLTSDISPPREEFSRLAGQLRQWLFDQINAQSLSRDWLRGANIILNFSGEKAARSPGDTFKCVVTFTDDLGHAYQVHATGACWPHNPAIESKSARNA